MNIKNIEADHVEGPPWRIIARCATFEEADEKRTSLLAEENLQVKIHWMGAPQHRFFAVKTRVNPTIAIAEEAALKREEKKRRKARLNKKRRKK